VRTAAAVAAIVGWAGLAVLGIGLYQATPRQAGFDLELVLAAGRRWAAGASVYPPLGAGTSATDLFYSYPPPVAQAASLVASGPTWLVLVVLAIVAVAGILAVASALARASGRDPIEVTLVVAAVLPLVFPFSIGLLFGNLDVLVPSAVGAVLVALLAPSAPFAVVAGTALALVSIAKVYPALIGLWLLARAASREAERPAAAPILASALAAGVLVLVLSLAVGGVSPWSDWLRLIGGASSADLIDTRNVGPASLIAAGLGLGEPGVRAVQVAVLAVAGVAVVASARLVRDPVASLAIAVVASLVVLPITWLHYAAAVIPFGIALVLRDRRPAPARLLLVTAALVDGAAALLLPPVVWLGVAAVLAIPLVPPAISIRPREVIA
jgi:hypothetical protein